MSRQPHSANDPLWDPMPPPHRGRDDATAADLQFLAELEASGSFRPYRSPQRPSHTRSKRGTAMKNWKKAGYPGLPTK